VDGHAERGITADEIRADSVCQPAAAVSIGVGGDGGPTPRGHACALKRGGAVRCWGANDAGQLGNGTLAGSAVPVSVAGLSSGVTAVAAGGGHTCALLTSGKVKCWGDNFFGQLGNGTRTSSALPVDVVGLEGVTAIAAGAISTCAIAAGGRVSCWGNLVDPV